MSHQPLVSIISFCKDRAATIRRSIDSVLAQSYRDIELVIQDGASTDGTVEIIRSYDDPRIKLVSEPDSGPAEGFWKVMNRCRGEFIGTCLSDEELLPGAIEKAVELFGESPDAGAITCDGWITDAVGKIIDEFNAGEFNLADYLFGKYCPFWPGSFFRRQALIDVGWRTHDWTIECLEFETWCRLGTRHLVKYVPVRMSKYAIHTGQLSNTRQYFHEHFDNRAKIIRKLFSTPGFFGEDEVKLKGCLYNQLYLLYNHVKAYGLADQERLLLNRMKDLKASISIIGRVQYLEYFNFLDGRRIRTASAVSQDMAKFRRISNVWRKVVLALPMSARKRVPRPVIEFVRKWYTTLFYLALTAKSFVKRLGRQPRARVAESSESVPVDPEFSPKLYHDMAAIYYGRGQIAQALENWKKAEELNDPEIEALACQARLMLPEATYETLLAGQTQWARKFARPQASLPAPAAQPYDGKRKIRVAYFSAFMESYVMRVIALAPLKYLDREKFVVFGYGPSPVPAAVEAHFERYTATGEIPDREFVDLVRNDNIDIFIETSGLSPFNRLQAMASRCAPIQISYLNHTGTSAVPNIDYVLADRISVLPEEQKWFTEEVWHLPGSFLCYNYDDLPMPPVADRPSKRRGHITFGCFGSGGKIGDKLIATWARVLAKVPDSVLFLRNGQLEGEDNRQFMIERFRRHGIGEERLLLKGGTDQTTILSCYDDVDISLDTWPYCGGNTIAESIWQGVPVVTLKGNRFSSRYGASLVAAGGCPELIANSFDEYVDLAVALSAQAERLDYYRANLRRLAHDSGLVDARRFAGHLSNSFVEMMRKLHRLQDPANARVSAIA